MALSRQDPFSYGRPDLAAVTHTKLELFVDFEHKVLKGKAIITIAQIAQQACDKLVLDTHELKICSVKDFYTKKHLKYDIGDRNMYGNEFIINLPNVDERKINTFKIINTDEYSIQIKYKTSPNSPALYWLKPDQTSDGTDPLLISNSKFAYARAIFPCQDTPSHKIKFDVKISVPMGFKVKMPGTCYRTYVEETRCVHTFSGTMPSNAMYIIVGSLEELRKRKSLERGRGHLKCSLLTERKYIEQSSIAFNRIMDVLLIFNRLYGFRGDFNVCVLPPNVPEFDMQCPFMTFVSSTSLDGNASMINTIVPNILESWIGRLVTIENFEHLWLIKSLSTFIYRDPTNNIVSEEVQKVLKVKSIKYLINMSNLHADIPLVPDLKGVLPKNYIIKYVSEKGYLFLDYLQHILDGPAVFIQFVQYYLNVCVFGILTTGHFKEHLCKFFSDKTEALDSVNFDTWFFESNLPLSYSERDWKIDWHYTADWWIAAETREALFRTTQKLSVANELIKIEFLSYVHALPTVLPKYKLDMLYCAIMHDQHICEIRFRWLRLCIKSQEMSIQTFTDALDFACQYCMPKYACQIFFDLCEWTVTRRLTVSWFKDEDRRFKMLPETIEELKSILHVKLDDETTNDETTNDETTDDKTTDDEMIELPPTQLEAPLEYVNDHGPTAHF